MKNDSTKEPITKEPITVEGWYEHTDGTVGYYKWITSDSGVRVNVCDMTVADWSKVPSREERRGY